MPRVIVASGFVAQYPQGGGMFSVVLQYLLGLRRLGCEVCWLELLWPQGPHDRTFIRTFAERLADDWERLVIFYQLPHEHWPHLRTSNVVESPFATVRLRTTAAKHFKKVGNATALI